MTESALTIHGIKSRAVIAPMKRPIRTAIGTIPSAPLVLIDVFTDQGPIGRSYLFTFIPSVLAPLVRLIDGIAEELKGQRVAPVERMRDFDRRFRLIGWQGLIGMAVSGLDMAFWDVTARAAEQSVVQQMGGVPSPISAYDSYGIIDPVADENEILRTVREGFRAIKIKLGDGDVDKDQRAVRAVREMIGPDIRLMVDYNQSLDPIEACWRIARLADYDLHWVEEPVKAEDIHGHAQVRRASKVPVQTGENWWFPSDMAKAVACGACDYAMIDIMKIGGATGWISAMGQAHAASLPVSSHLFLEASSHMLAITPTAHWLEYLDVASAVLRIPYQAENGTLSAKGPGFGLDWDEREVKRYKAT